jgi:hypothetical protein
MLATLALAFTLAPAALAEPTAHRLGEHPAVIAKQLHASQGYDYASKFYPHPAWLYLAAQPPGPGLDPSLAVARQEQPPIDGPQKTALQRAQLE